MDKPSSIDPAKLQSILALRSSGDRADLLPLLLQAQDTFRHIPEEVARAIGRALRVPLAEIHGVIEFYSMLYSQPVGRTIVRVCASPPCAMKGGPEALEAAGGHLGIAVGETSAGGDYTLEESPCLALCNHAPAALARWPGLFTDAQ